MLKTYWLNGVSPSRTRLFGSGVNGSVRSSHGGCGAGASRMGDTGHLDELFVTLQARRQYLWRAVDEDAPSHRTAAFHSRCKSSAWCQWPRSVCS